jgi:2-polyprenyl-3-methyl-5-hydroxy-6-metoxy-1,4-benzoquinol methylase
MARIQFALKMALARLRSGRNRCPYCESCLHHRLQRKWLLIEARKCAYCGLIFRYPTDDANETSSFYEDGYSGQQATDLPEGESLAQLLQTNFINSPYDKSHRMKFLKSVRGDGRVLDFGCAWGYSLYQLRRSGYEPAGFELARNRAEFGRRHLDVEIHSDWNTLLRDGSGSFDLVYTDHALEHTPNLRQPLEAFARLLKPAGKLVIFVPNGSSLLGRQLGVGWGPFIGESHTIAFTDNWYAENLPRHGFVIEQLISTTTKGGASLPDGEELVCVARRN